MHTVIRLSRYLSHILVRVSQVFVAHISSYGKPCGSVVKNPPANATVTGDAGSIPALGIFPGEGNGYPLQYSSLQQYVNFQMFKLDLEKAEEPEIKLPTSFGSLKKQGGSRKTSTSALLTTPKPLTVWITTNCGKFLKRWEYQTT